MKAFAGEVVTAGSILVRQRGTKFHPGAQVRRGGDDTLFATVSGKVEYHTRAGRQYVSIVSGA